MHRETNRDLFIELLQEIGFITAADIDSVKPLAADKNISLIEALKDAHIVSDKDIASALAFHFGVEQVNLAGISIDPSLWTLIPKNIVRDNKIVPIKKDEHKLVIAAVNPVQLELFDLLRDMTGFTVEAAVAPENEILEVIEARFKEEEEKKDDKIGQFIEDLVKTTSEEDLTVGNPMSVMEALSEEDEDAPVIKLVTLIIREAYNKRASDIHFEPLNKKFRVRYRIDGVLHEVDAPPKRLQSSIISRLKIMANMSIAEKRLPLDGRIRLAVDDNSIDLRVSSIPTVFGESLVLRILDKTNLLLDLSELGLFADDEKKLRDIISRPNGIILLTGPTGSGKTTSLYAQLNYLNKPDKKIITVEDPIEYQIQGINQVQVNADINMTFSRVLRAMMRQAPNVIMVGEIRDLETAKIAINAALTGHLVFSTLHTNDAPGAVTRLLDQGVVPFLVASSLQAVIAQRLLRKVCTNCKVKIKPVKSELAAFGISDAELKDADLYKGKGCDVCSGLGYKGRIAVYEILIFNEVIRQLVYKKVTSVEIKKAARKAGMKTLREDGIRKVLAGITTLEEVARVTQSDSSDDIV